MVAEEEEGGGERAMGAMCDLLGVSVEWWNEQVLQVVVVVVVDGTPQFERGVVSTLKPSTLQYSIESLFFFPVGYCTFSRCLDIFISSIHSWEK